MGVALISLALIFLGPIYQQNMRNQDRPWKLAFPSQQGFPIYCYTYQRTEVWVRKDVAVVGVQKGVAVDTQLEEENN